MNDNGELKEEIKKLDEQSKDILQPKDSTIKMEILFSVDKGISVIAPGDGKFYNMPTCLFLLDSAKDFIKQCNLNNSQPKIQHPPVNIINRIKNIAGGAFGKGGK